MKYIMDFSAYALMENFDLHKMYKQQNIIEDIQTEAKNIVTSFFKGASEVPKDMVKNRDKVEFWLAKQIKSYLLDKATESMNAKFKAGDKENADKIRAIINYYKGKSVDPSILEDEQVLFSLEFVKRYANIHKNELKAIFDYFLSPVRNIQKAINLVSASLQDMYEEQAEWHNNLKASGKIFTEEGVIIKRFPDGYYWIDLRTNSSRVEADAMGHCGTTNSDTILSLRKRGESGFITPHVTVAIDYDDDYRYYLEDGDGADGTEEMPTYSDIHQMKGKGNTKPVSAYHKYIVELLLDEDLGISGLAMDEYSPKSDFHLADLSDLAVLDRVLNEKPDLFGKLPLHLFKHRLSELVEKMPDLLDSKDVADVKTLLSEGFIDEAKARESLSMKRNLHIADGKIYAVVENVSDLAFAFDEGSRNSSSRAYAKEILSASHLVEFYHLGFDDVEFDLLDDENRATILDRMEKKLSFAKLAEDYMDLLEDADIDTEDIRDDLMNYDDDGDKLKELLLNVDEYYDINSDVARAYSDAAERSANDNAYTTVFDQLKGVFRPLEYDSTAGGFLVEITDDMAAYAQTADTDNYNRDMILYVEGLYEEDYEEHMGEEYVKLGVDEPYHGWDYDVDTESFNECLKEVL
jgi:hypothetical protein